MSDVDPGWVPPVDVVVLSGASRGLGLAIFESLLASGLSVAGFARSVTPEMASLAETYPDTAIVGAVDITDSDGMKTWLDDVEDNLGVVTGLVNNAAIGQDSLHVHTPERTIEEIVTVNLIAPLVLTRAVLRRMLANGRRGRIVNITSICGARGYPGLVAYSATKGGMEAATRSLAREFGGRVLANAIAPGFFASEMSAVLGQTQLDQILRRTPSQRLTEPEDVVPIVQMLLTDHTNINGQTIVIDGGGSI